MYMCFVYAVCIILIAGTLGLTQEGGKFYPTCELRNETFEACPAGDTV